MYVGQQLLNPPSVEGWHTGTEWIDTGILVERVNFAAGQVGDTTKPGVRRIVERLRERGDLSPEQLVDGCLELIGPLRVSERNRDALLRHAEEGGPVRWSDDPSPPSSGSPRCSRCWWRRGSTSSPRSCPHPQPSPSAGEGAGRVGEGVRP